MAQQKLQGPQSRDSYEPCLPKQDEGRVMIDT